jgi:hypothetical protein
MTIKNEYDFNVGRKPTKFIADIIALETEIAEQPHNAITPAMRGTYCMKNAEADAERRKP